MNIGSFSTLKKQKERPFASLKELDNISNEFSYSKAGITARAYLFKYLTLFVTIQ